MPEIRTAASDAEIRQFVQLPFALYNGDRLWAPPLVKQDMELLDDKRHPFWKSARRRLLTAWENGRPVGRIAAIVDDKYNDYARENCGSFGFFECADNEDAAHALLQAAREWLEKQGMNRMRGPLNPSANYTCGVLVQGFDLPPAVMMPYNRPYYPVYMESWGLRKEEDLFAYVIEKDKMALSPLLRQELERIKSENRFTCRPACKDTLAEDIHTMLELYRVSWAENWGFSPLSPQEAEQHVKELKGVLDPDFFVLFFCGDKPAAGMVALPDMNPLLRRLNGKIGLTAPWHFLRSRAQVAQGMRIMLFGILPEYRLQGLPLLLLDYMLTKAARKPGLAWVEGSWILERNYAMNDLMEEFSGKLAKRYRIYGRRIGVC